MTQEELNRKKTDIKNSISKQQEKLKEITANIETKTKKLEEISVPDTTPSQEAVDISNYIEELKTTKATIEEAISADQQRLKEYELIEPTENTTSVNSNEMTQSDQEKNAKLAAEHPERVVDGIYYADDDALASAKEAYEKKVQEETKLATAEATANANKLAAAMKRINETLYGTDNQEVIEQLQGTVGGAELSSILGNAVDVRARQKLLDFKKFKDDFKAPNAGKRQNNIVQRYCLYAVLRERL